MSQPQILINNIDFSLANGKVIFNSLTLSFSQCKTGLIGRNGIGKSTLLKLILNELSTKTGSIHVEGQIGFVPQNLIVPDHLTVAGFLACEEKINALRCITEGSIDENDFEILNDDWTILERVKQGLHAFDLSHITYLRPVNTLSGGEMTRLSLAKAFFSQPDFLLLDEPTNHLDSTAREQLYQAISAWQGGLIVVSHDRTLLNFMETIIELTTLGANSYGGNYNAYEKQKEIEHTSCIQQLHDAKKLMQKTKTTIQSSREKHEQKQSYGRALRESGSIDKMAANSKRGKSERSQSKLLIKEERLIKQAETLLDTAKDKLEINDAICIDLPATIIPNDKIILEIKDLSFSYETNTCIIDNFSLIIQGPQRIALRGDNGSGKTTLIHLILQKLLPQKGYVRLGTTYVKYLDQRTSLLCDHISVLENFLHLNPDSTENDAYRHLAQFLFRNVSTHKLVKNLSGGERLRALLACVLMAKYPPHLLILDEPTNHLDIHSIKSIESALHHYKGAIIVISHDKQFLQNIGIERMITAPFTNKSLLSANELND